VLGVLRVSIKRENDLVDQSTHGLGAFRTCVGMWACPSSVTLPRGGDDGSDGSQPHEEAADLSRLDIEQGATRVRASNRPDSFESSHTNRLRAYDYFGLLLKI
jgi:hypothetical protein